MKTILFTLLRGTTMIVATAVLTSLALPMAAGWMLKAQPDEWSIPLRVGTPGFGVRIEAGVALRLRGSTNPVGILLLDGRSLTTPYGTLHFSRIDDEHFAVDCRPCRLKLPALGDEPLALASVRITGTQRADALQGSIAAGGLAGPDTEQGADAAALPGSRRWPRVPNLRGSSRVRGTATERSACRPRPAAGS